jgi:ADP-ribosylglycohydrolase
MARQVEPTVNTNEADRAAMGSAEHDGGHAGDSVTSESPSRHRRTREHFRGCLLGVAVGDALGAPVEFLSLPEIRRRFGPGGVRDMEVAYGRRGAITDDTQMSLFTADGVIRARSRGRERGIRDRASVIHHAYVRWLWTQGRSSKSSWKREEADGWLFGLRELHQLRAPGHTCLSALEADFDGPATNDSKGCGGVMRVAPIGMLHDGDAFALARQAAHLTHGHPAGHLAAGTFAELLDRLFEGDSLDAALDHAIERHVREAGEGETTHALRRARELAATEPPSAELVERLGGGWIAEEALAIGVYCALVHRDDFASGVRLAVNHSGDSDSTGCIAGAILGALNGVDAIPEAWLRELELRDVITQVADDLFDPDGADWERYPGW